MHNQLDVKDYLMGIASIDEQHAKLLEMINLLSDGMAMGDARPVLESLIERLYAFAQSHFAYEEELMERTGYPNLEAHRTEHRAYLTRLTELLHRWAEGGGFMIAVDVHDLITLWATEHIIESDHSYATHLKQHGIT
ncbi:MAG: bacteriohemerythrin [bacterium]|nr:bacteriohemerythrin [bacterium]